MDKTKESATAEPDRSDDEVFFSGASNTSTPAETRSKKRKRTARTSPRRTRLRSRMSGSESSMTSVKESEDNPSVESLLAKMAKQMEEMGSNMAGIEGRITAGVASAVAPLTARLDAGNLRMDRLERRQNEMGQRLEDRIDKVLNDKMDGVTSGHAAGSGSETSKDIFTYAKAVPTRALTTKITNE